MRFRKNMRSRIKFSYVISSLMVLAFSSLLSAQEVEEIDKTDSQTRVDQVEKNETSEEQTPLPLEQIKTFADIFTRIKLSYVEPVTDEQLLDYAVEGMLAGLDPHSVYLKGDSYQELDEDTKGQFTGLGLEVVMEGGFVKVIAPIDDTPAAKAGIKSGDLIIRINGEVISGLTLNEATEKMRGEQGTNITLTILRESEPDPFDLEITRAIVKLSSVKRKRLSDEIGYLRVTQFQLNTSANFRKQLKMLRQGKSFSGLVLDLRNNPGGLLTSAVSISDTFITQGNLVSTKGRSDSSKKDYEATAVDLIDGKPIVVLVNGGSASASEIVAGALQDHKRAIVMGTETFGKGSVQTVLNINDADAIKLTTARYFTPSGRSIQAAGIVPDVIVQQREFKETTQTFKRIKENDLPGHLDNERDVEGESNTDETKQLLAGDYQLNEAFNLLKGLILFDRKSDSQTVSVSQVE
ncbi:S41 family peptidase [Arenicella sp. 4NH20-0111]|uniref:S41 family peptidase n=1 Tax=Arenicella sp. 4NH20-0111 TaxID=3127648 RepID=UPI00333EDCA1